MTTYRDSGVDVDLGNDASKVLYEAAKITWENRKGRLGELIVPFDDFSGVRAIDVSNLPEGTLMNIGFDGVGTKIELAERVADHRTIAHDLFAMVCDDAVVRGAEPVLIGSVLDVNSLKHGTGSRIDEIKQLAEGYIDAARAANVAIVNGEIAELGNRVGGFADFNYNWCASVVWFARRERMLTGREIREGDFIVGLKEEGFRSNGLSLVRKIMHDNHGGNCWHLYDEAGNFDDGKMAREILTPSRIYSAAIVDMIGGYDPNRQPRAEIHGIAHITGGGIPEKLGRLLKPSGFGAFIDNPIEPSRIMRYVQTLGKVRDAEAYRTWNMGPGMLALTPRPQAVMDVASEYGISSQVIGQVTREPGINIRSKGTEHEGRLLKFE